MLNNALKAIRLYHRLSQTELAQKLKTYTSFISEIESGNRAVSYKTLEKYSKAFEMKIYDILILKEMLERGEAKIEIPKKFVLLYEWSTGEEFRVGVK